MPKFMKKLFEMGERNDAGTPTSKLPRGASQSPRGDLYELRKKEAKAIFSNAIKGVSPKGFGPTPPDRRPESANDDGGTSGGGA